MVLGGSNMNFDITWIIAIISITGSFFNIGKKAICFYFWIVCEIICFIIDIQNGQYGRAFLDLFCIGMNIYGIFSWSKSDKAQKKNGVEENEGFGITNKELNDQS